MSTIKRDATYQLSEDGQDLGLEYRVTPFTTVNRVPLSWHDSLSINTKCNMSDSIYTISLLLFVLLRVESEVRELRETTSRVLA
jgi:hypothetical protein